MVGSFVETYDTNVYFRFMQPIIIIDFQLIIFLAVFYLLNFFGKQVLL